MREEKRPAAIAMEGGQSEESLVTGQAPELAGELEAALVLRTGGFDSARADGLAETFAFLEFNRMGWTS